MSAATVSLTRKINGGNDLLSIGGVDAQDFLRNLGVLLDSDADAVVKEIHAAFVPVAAGDPDPWGQPPVPPYVPPAVTQAFPQAQPVQPVAATSAPVCAGHGQPAIWRQKKDNSGGFFKCQVNDSIISEFNDSSKIKNFCPAAKPR